MAAAEDAQRPRRITKGVAMIVERVRTFFEEHWDLAATVVGPPKHEVVRLAGEFGIATVFLPVAHPELNPIESIWGVAKHIVRERNGVVDMQDEYGFRMPFLEKHVHDALDTVTAGMWGRFEDECI